MDAQQNIVDVETSSGTMAVLHTKPADGGNGRKVAIFFDAPGIRGDTEAFCQKLAADGYEVVVPDLYHRHERLFHVTPARVAEDETLMARMWELLGSLDDDEIQTDMDDAMAGVGWSGPVGTMGFCLGARAVHRAMTRAPEVFAAGGMFHPSFLTNDPNPPYESVGQLTGGLHIGIGTADQVQSIEMHQAYFDAIASMDNVELTIFEGADHGYTWPGGANHHAEASDTSYAKTVALFEAAL